LCRLRPDDGVLTPGAPANPLVLPQVSTNATADYSFSVTNDLGGPAESSIGLTVIPAPSCALSPVAGFPNALLLSFPTLLGRSYFVEEAAGLPGTWTPWPSFFIGNGAAVNAYVWKSGNRFYRVRVE
jgi:hypothetical protein